MWIRPPNPHQGLCPWTPLGQSPQTPLPTPPILTVMTFTYYSPWDLRPVHIIVMHWYNILWYKDQRKLWSRCRLGADSCGLNEPCIRWGPDASQDGAPATFDGDMCRLTASWQHTLHWESLHMVDECIRRREGWQDGDAASCLDTCCHCYLLFYNFITKVSFQMSIFTCSNDFTN